MQIETRRQLTILNKANENLKVLFKEKHQTITREDVEKAYARNPLGIENAKTTKGEASGYLTGILYLAPANLSGINTCPGASTGCKFSCLFTAGRGRFYSITRARVIKTLAFYFDQSRYIWAIKKDINRIKRKALKNNQRPVIRLNGTSDILWERMSIMDHFPDVQFYDYTKIWHRFDRPLPANYHLTFSMHEENGSRIGRLLDKGVNVAIVFDEVPKSFGGFTVIDGDKSDLRFLDGTGERGKGLIIGLKAKGKAKKDDSGFVIRLKKEKAA